MGSVCSELGNYTSSSQSLETLTIRQCFWMPKMDVVYYFKTWRYDLSLPKTQR
jgi:hypothetical protein